MAAALAASLLLTSCSLSDEDEGIVNSLVAKALIELELRKLAQQLKSIDGIESVTASQELTVELDYRIQVKANSSATTVVQATEVLTHVCTTFASDAFSPHQHWFELVATNGAAVNLSQCDMSAAERAVDLAYYVELSGAYRAPLTLSFYDSGQGGYVRGIAGRERVTDWSALLAVERRVHCVQGLELPRNQRRGLPPTRGAHGACRHILPPDSAVDALRRQQRTSGYTSTGTRTPTRRP